MKTIIEELAALPLIVRGSHDDVFKAVRALQERAQKTQTEPCDSARRAAEEIAATFQMGDTAGKTYQELRNLAQAVISKHFAPPD